MIVAQSPGYVSSPSERGFGIPPDGTLWRVRADFELVRPDDAQARYGMPLCPPPQATPSATITTTPTPSPPPRDQGTQGRCYNPYSNTRADDGGLAEISGEIRGLAEGVAAAVLLYEAPSSPTAFCPPRQECNATVDVKRVQPLSTGLDDHLRAVLPVRSGRWSYRGPELKGTILVQLSVTGGGKASEGYTVSWQGVPSALPARGLDFDIRSS